MFNELDSIDRRLLDAIQSEFPLDEHPFHILAQRLSITESDTIDYLNRLKTSGIIRQISAIFDSASLGYQSVLLAFQVPEDRIEEAARAISEHPGVSHNYQRSHPYSIWCTLTVPPESNLQLHATALARIAGADKWLFLPATRLFKIGVNFRMGDAPAEHTVPLPVDQEKLSSQSSPSVQDPSLSETDRNAIYLLQKDLAITTEPFADLAQGSSFAPSDLIGHARTYLKTGIMRRYAAILRHTKAGYGFNIMSVWAVPESRSEEVGAILASFPEVSHCYQRPIAPDWPYSHFAMLHAKSEPEAMAAVERMQQATAIEIFSLLRSVREFKKSRVQYFTPDIAEWEAHNLTTNNK